MLTDTRNFLDRIAAAKNFFLDTEEVVITRAPGRLDVMGGIADYSGSLVLQLPIADATHVALQKSDSTMISVLSVGKNSERRSIEVDLSEFLINNREPIDYPAARQRFSNAENHWAAYVVGTFIVLMREEGIKFDRGAKILITSNVPEGKGVSSSAAIEVAAMQAVAIVFGIDLKPQAIARLCQKVENLIAGAPCGIMDQMTSACGEENRLLELLCQPDILRGTLALPEDLAVWGVDSGVRHSVSGADYGTVRTAAFMGYRIIAEGLPISSVGVGKVQIKDTKWNGYLANVTTEEFENEYAQKLPSSVNGAAFLKRFEGITDSVTSVDSNRDYPVRQATKHPIYEHARVKTFASLLKNWSAIEQGPELGALMFESHQSYSDCGLGSEATDLISELVREYCEEGLFGARITGGGSGGTVAVLGRRDASAALEKVRQRFSERTGYEPLIISGSSPGACIFNHLKLDTPVSTNTSTV